MTRRRRAGAGVLAWGVGLAAAGAFFVVRIALVPDAKPEPRDLLTYFHPSYRATAAQLAGGVVPLWNPYQLCGIPWLAGLQAGVLYPPHLLFLLLPLRVAMAALAAAHLALAAFASFFLARRFGLAVYAALLVALLLVARGALPTWIGTPSLLEASAWLVPGCLGVLAACEGRRRAALLWLGLAMGMSSLAGHPQSTTYCVALWLGLLVGLLVERRAPLRHALGAAGSVAAGILLGIAIAAAQLLPALELAREGTRSLGGLSLLHMFPLGAPTLESILPDAASIGFVALASLPCALLGARRGIALVWIALGGLTLAFALGPATPLFAITQRLPVLGAFRNPQRIVFTTDLCVALVAGIGLDALAHAASRVARASARAAPGRGPRTARLAGWIALALATGQLLRDPPRSNGWAVHEDPSARAVIDAASALPRRAWDPNGRVWIVSPGLTSELPPRLASVLGLHSLDDYEPANLRLQAEYFGFLELGLRGLEDRRSPFMGRVYLLGRGTDRAALEQRRRLLDLAAARFVLVTSRSSEGPAFRALERDAGFSLVGETPQLRLYENPSALPRAFVVYRTAPAPPRDKLLARLARPGFDPRALSYVEGDPGFTSAPGAPQRGGDARIVRETLHTLEIAATLEAPGLVVLADSYYPGWRAWVDGDEVEIRHVNHLFRGVPAPTGAHRIRFEYRPWSFRAGAAISLAASALWLGLAVWSWAGFIRLPPPAAPR